MADFDAIIFDFDGVLADSIKVHGQVRRQVLNELGYHISPDVHNQAHVHGTHTPDIIGWTLKRAGIIDESADVLTNPVVQQVVALKDQRYYEQAAMGIDAVPGAIDFVKRATARYGVERLAIATAAFRVQEVLPFLARHGLTDNFGTIFSAERTPLRLMKPHPFVYIQAAEELHIRPQRIVVIEDSAKGVMAGKAAGMQVYALTTTHSREQLVPAQPDVIVDSFEDLSVLV